MSAAGIPVSRERLAELLRRSDPLAAARAAGIAGARTVSVVRPGAAGDAMIDGDEETPLAAHRAAHAQGRASEAAVAYGAGHAPEDVAERIAGLAALARETGLLRAVCPVPAEGTQERPGSWGVEDLTVIAACRLALPADVAVRPHWRRLGPAACQIAVAFGASQWLVPEDDNTDVDRLAGAVGVALERS